MSPPRHLASQTLTLSRASHFDPPPAEVEHFSPGRVSEKVLFHLLRHPSVNQEVHFDQSNRLSPNHYLYTRNHPVDYFILLLQVCVHATTKHFVYSLLGG